MVRNSVGIRVDGRVPSASQVGRNNIIVDNGIGLEVDFGSGPTWDHNLVFGNTQNYSGIADQTGMNGNLSADPLFESPGSNNFQLQPGSPAIGAGSALDAPSVDFNGNPRPPGSIDIGAFQSSITDSDLHIGSHAPVTVDATSPAGAVVRYLVPAATDPDDPTPPSVSCSPAPGASFRIGHTTVICTATDPDDSNSPQSSEFKVTVLGAPAQLANLARAVKGVGPGTSLADMVAQARSYLASGHVADACGTLGAFVNEVKAQSGITIPSVTARKLIADAQRIQAVLAC